MDLSRGPASAMVKGLLLTLLGAACEGKFELQTSAIEAECLDQCPKITEITPLAALPGESLTLKGEHFREGMTIHTPGGELEVSVLSPSEALMTIPDGGPGEVPIAAQLREFRGEEASYFRLALDYPLITKAPDKVCKGEKYYNAKGELKEGAKDCTPSLAGLDPNVILEGYQVGGVEGKLPICASGGQSGCVNQGDFKAAYTPEIAAKVLSGKEVAGVKGQITLPSAAQVVTGVTYGVGGTQFTGTAVVAAPPSCTGDGETGCVATTTFKAALTTGLGDKVLAGETVAGVAGNLTLPGVGSVLDSVTYGVGGSQLTGTISDCSANGQDGCFLDSGNSYDAADLTNLSVGNIKSGVTIAGQTGQYPSATYPLPGASGTLDLDSATFDAKMQSATGFEYWTSDGSRQTGAGDSDITASNVVTGVTIFGVSGSVPQAQCNAGTEGPCEADTACRWTGSTCEINPWHIRTGITIAGQAGEIKANCRNRADGAIFDADSMPPGTLGTTAGSTIHWWDTIDYFRNDSDSLPQTLPSGWSSEHMCGKELFSDQTADGACDSDADDCMIRDEVTGLIWSESFPQTGVAATDTTDDWSDAVAHCDGLTFGGRSDWRLPTQLELMRVYEHGIREVGYKGGGDYPAFGGYFG